MLKYIFDNLACNNCDSRSTFSLNIFLYLIIVSFVFYYTGIQKKKREFWVRVLYVIVPMNSQVPTRRKKHLVL